ncbi:MAG: methyl-accepting chemotaxis protein [Firmicutes bacterium]|nr:methyl-accepting chemotaxis protein [Bacillota bacterium]
MFKNMKLVNKIIFLAVIIVVINLALQGNFIWNIRNTDLESMESRANSLSQQQAKIFSDEFKHIEFVVKSYSEDFAILIKNNNLSREDAIAIMSDSLIENASVVAHGMGFEPGTFDGRDSEYQGMSNLGSDGNGRFLPYIYFDGNNNVAVEDLVGYDVPGDGDWYLIPKKTGKPIITEPYFYPINGVDVLMFTISYPVKVDGGFIGVVTADVAIDSVQKNLIEADTRRELNIESFMFTNMGTAIAATVDESLINTDISSDESISKILSSDGNESYFGETKFVDGKQLVVSYPVNFISKDTKWYLMNNIPEKVILSKYQNQLKINLIVIAIALIIIVLLIYFISRSIKRPITKLSDTIEKIGMGDLTESCDMDTRDEIGQLSKNFDSMIDKMKDLIRNVQQSAGVVGDSSGKMLEYSNESVDSINGVTTIVSEIAEANVKQSEDIEGIVQKTASLSNMINEMNQVIAEVTSISEDTQNISNQGIEILSDLDEKTNDTREKSREISVAVQDVNTSIVDIENITSMIDSIAAQTNLLALNASIEAARAGEAGKGFAVVADEIRKLAEETGSATNEIKDIVLQVINKSQTAVVSVDEVSKSQEEQFEIIKKSISTFDEINKSFIILSEKINAVDNNASVIDRNKEDIMDAISNISAVSEETTASTEEATSTMIEQKHSIEELRSYSEGLQKMTEELEKQVGQFRV